MENLTSFKDERLNEKNADSVKEVEGVYQKMLSDPRFASSPECAEQLSTIADKILAGQDEN